MSKFSSLWFKFPVDQYMVTTLYSPVTGISLNGNWEHRQEPKSDSEIFSHIT